MGESSCQKWISIHNLTPYSDVNREWIIGPNVKLKAIQFLEQNKGKIYLALFWAKVS